MRNDATVLCCKRPSITEQITSTMLEKRNLERPCSSGHQEGGPLQFVNPDRESASLWLLSVRSVNCVVLGNFLEDGKIRRRKLDHGSNLIRCSGIMGLSRLVAPLLQTTDRAGINGSRTVHPLPCLIRAPLTACVNSTPCRNIGIRQQGPRSRWVKQQSVRTQPDDTNVTLPSHMSVRCAFSTLRPSFTRWGRLCRHSKLQLPEARIE